MCSADTRPLGSELARYGLLIPNTWAELCTRVAMKQLLGDRVERLQLSYVASYLGFDMASVQVHRAAGDVLMMRAALNKAAQVCLGPAFDVGSVSGTQCVWVGSKVCEWDAGCE